jgi:hypothetical protein
MWRRGRVPPPWPCESWRRRRGKSRIWDGGVWSQVRRDSDPRVTALAMAGGGPVLSSGRGPRIGRPAAVWQWWKTGRGSQIGALFRVGLADWPSVVTWASTRPVHAWAATNTNAKSGGTFGGGVLYSIRLEHQGIAHWPSGVWSRIRTTSTVALRVLKFSGKGTQWLGV